MSDTSDLAFSIKAVEAMLHTLPPELQEHLQVLADANNLSSYELKPSRLQRTRRAILVTKVATIEVAKATGRGVKRVGYGVRNKLHNFFEWLTSHWIAYMSKHPTLYRVLVTMTAFTVGFVSFIVLYMFILGSLVALIALFGA